MADNNGLVMVTVGIAVIGAETKSFVGNKGLTARPIIGGFALGFFLLTISLMSAEIARAFCYLIIVTALLVNGAAIFGLSGGLSK